MTKHTTVIGGGMAGLAAAYELQRAVDQGRPVRYALVEREDRLGGKVRTEQIGPSRIEAGPDSYLAQKPWATELIRELGLEDQLIPSRDHLQRVCVVHQRKLVPFPAGFRLAVPTALLSLVSTPLFSPAAKLRMAVERFIPPRRDPGDESLAAFIRRRLGDEALHKLAGPMMAGIYSADPERLSILATFPMFRDMERTHGSLTRGMTEARKRMPARSGHGGMFLSLREGMRVLPDAIRPRLTGDVRLGSTVQSIRRAGTGYQVTLDGTTLETDRILLAIPAFAAAPLLEPLLPEAAERLRAIRYLSTATVSLQYPRDGFTALRDGTVGNGFVVPLGEQKTLTACTLTSCKFAHRTDEASVLLRAFVGGPINSASVDLPDDELVARVRDELRELSGIEQTPGLVRIHRWPRGNPQYDVGHLDRIHELDTLLDRNVPGIRITGSACRGVGLPDVIRQGRDATREILDA